MTDVQLHDLPDRGNRLHVVIVHAVAGMHDQPEAARVARSVANALQLARLSFAARIGVGTGV
jgi:hypothetical protein